MSGLRVRVQGLQPCGFRAALATGGGGAALAAGYCLAAFQAAPVRSPWLGEKRLEKREIGQVDILVGVQIGVDAAGRIRHVRAVQAVGEESVIARIDIPVAVHVARKAAIEKQTVIFARRHSRHAGETGNLHGRPAVGPCSVAKPAARIGSQRLNPPSTSRFYISRADNELRFPISALALRLPVRAGRGGVRRRITPPGKSSAPGPRRPPAAGVRDASSASTS